MVSNNCFVKGELIGLPIEVIESKNKSLVGIKGKIVDETRNMLILETSKGIRKIIKSEVKMRIKLNKEKLEVDGKLLVGRPEDRIKKARRLR